MSLKTVIQGAEITMLFSSFRLESSDSSGADSEPLFFDDEERLPVHEWGLGRCKNVHEAANILLIEEPSANVSRVVPVNINKNVSFIIDTSAIDHIDDLKCDEMGSWDCVGVKSAHFRKKSAKVKKVAEKKYHREEGHKDNQRESRARFYLRSNKISLPPSRKTKN